MAALRTPANWLAGYIPDIPTPFRRNGELDLNAFANFANFRSKPGVSAIVVGETAGEASTLTPDEHDRIIRSAVEAAPAGSSSSPARDRTPRATRSN